MWGCPKQAPDVTEILLVLWVTMVYRRVFLLTQNDSTSVAPCGGRNTAKLFGDDLDKIIGQFGELSENFVLTLSVTAECSLSNFRPTNNRVLESVGCCC